MKRELKTGMIITTRENEKFMVVKDVALCVNPINAFVRLDGKAWNVWDSYNEDMTHKVYDNLDIMKVEKCCNVTDLLNPKRETAVIWERKEKKRYTYAQLREILGEEFEVVG